VTDREGPRDETTGGVKRNVNDREALLTCAE
jgi:hypothetical protein